MPSSYQGSVSVVARSSPLLQPASRGSFQCFCHGEVVEMLAQYGWLKVCGDVDHAFSEKHQGHVFVNKKDIAKGCHLTVGDAVTFYLYVDGKGLGAEVCEKPRSDSTFAQDSWHKQSSWMRQPHFSRESQQAVCYMPVGVVMGALPGTVTPQYEGAPFQAVDKICATGNTDQGKVEPADDCDVLDSELPSVGSVGHSDGSCKRCAFFPKGRCQNGKDCAHCHFDHTSRQRLRKRKPARARSLINNTQEPWRAQLEDEEEEFEARPHVDKEDLTDDIATIAPSSSPSDDEERTSTHSPFEVSDSESSNGSAVAFDRDKDQTNSSQNSSPRSESYTSEGFSPSPTSWSAQQRIRKVGASKEVSTAEIARIARALLNKLTHERFEALCGQILELPLSSSEHLTALAAEMFEIATTQDGFRPMYTELCVRLDAHLSEKRSAIGGKAFRKALVSACQKTFERNLQPPDLALFSGLTGEEHFELEMKLKTRRLGNMRFIGELLVRGLLAQKLMPPIVLELLHGDEAALESLIALLTIIAPFFEQKESLYQSTLRDTLATLRRKEANKGISSRVRCHLRDLFDFHARGWAVRSA